MIYYPLVLQHQDPQLPGRGGDNMGKYKKILHDEIGGYHKQVNKMKTNDTTAFTNVKKRRNVF